MNSKNHIQKAKELHKLSKNYCDFLLSETLTVQQIMSLINEISRIDKVINNIHKMEHRKAIKPNDDWYLQIPKQFKT